MKLVCPNCGEEMEHEIISMKSVKKGVEYTLKCKKCGYVYKKTIPEEKMKELKVIWSDRDRSEVKKIYKLEEDILTVGDEISVENINSQITAIDSGGKRVNKAKVGNIDTLWAKRFDRVIVKISVNRGSRTASYEITSHPDEEFYIGDIIEINGRHVVIHKIKIMEKFITRGGARARDIVRIYAKEIKESTQKY